MNKSHTVKEFNLKVAKLIKELGPEEIVEVLSSEESLINMKHDKNIHRRVSPEAKSQIS